VEGLLFKTQLCQGNSSHCLHALKCFPINESPRRAWTVTIWEPGSVWPKRAQGAVSVVVVRGKSTQACRNLDRHIKEGFFMNSVEPWIGLR